MDYTEQLTNSELTEATDNVVDSCSHRLEWVRIYVIIVFVYRVSDIPPSSLSSFVESACYCYTKKVRYYSTENHIRLKEK